VEVPAAALDALDLDISLRVEIVTRAGLAATRVHVEVPTSDQQRHLADVVALLGPLPETVRELATAVFRRLARAEAAVHGVGIEEVHFHEVGALDSIADVVGVAAGLCHLSLAHVGCSVLSLGSGAARSAHGPLPVPVPAVLALVTDVPVQAGPAPFESTTPTGAAVLCEVVDHWGPLPPMRVHTTGVGAGARDPDELANVLRLVLGAPVEPTTERPDASAS
jgi:uncharacterized protein (DUF111 family)